MKRLLVIALLTLIAGNLRAEDVLVQGLLPLSLPSFPGAADPLDELVITGVNASGGPATLVLRIDDDRSVDYRRRVNEERMVAPGPFELTFPAKALRRSNGEAFDMAGARRLFLFAAGQKVSATISRRKSEALPGGAIGYDLGPSDAAIYPGFQPLGPADPRLISGRAVAIRRAGAPLLTGTGLVGGTVYRFQATPGRWRVSLWIEDPGEWETLPHPLNRRVRVNGQDVVNFQWTPEEWIERRYLRLSRHEPEQLTSAWSAFGRLRGGRVDAVIDVADDAIDVELAGEGASATYLAGVLMQPDDGSPSVADAVDLERGRRFDEDWPVYGELRVTPTSAPLLLARGGSGRIEIEVPPGRRPIGLDYQGDLNIWAFEGRWSLERWHTGRNLLRPSAAHLTPLGADIARNPALPRRVVLWVAAAKSAASGHFVGSLRLDDGAVIPFSGEVLPIKLPRSRMPVGAYLERAPHLDWFAGGERSGDAQTVCDLQILARFGLTTVAPPLPPATSDAGPAYIQRLQSLTTLGFRGPIVAYAPLKRLVGDVGLDEAPSQLANLAATLGPDLMRRILWSVADEPSNAMHGSDLAEASAKLHERVPGFRAAAHLNHPNDLKDLRGVDVALVNPGMTLEPALFSTLREAGVTPWLYNMGNPRLAAGFWGIASGAAGYLQWHARMPTADPFDPTDGREGDVQFLFPTATVCPSQPDLHEDLLRLAEGVIDARWLAWLEATDPARAAQIRASVPSRWEDAVGLSDEALDELRKQILNVAHGLR